MQTNKTWLKILIPKYTAATRPRADTQTSRLIFERQHLHELAALRRSPSQPHSPRRQVASLAAEPSPGLGARSDGSELSQLDRSRTMMTLVCRPRLLGLG